MPLAAKAFELLVQTVSREDRDEDDEGSFDSGGRDSDNSVNTLLRNLDVSLRDVCASGVFDRRHKHPDVMPSFPLTSFWAVAGRR